MIRRLAGNRVVQVVAVVLPILRRLQPGTHPEVEVGRFLTEEAKFPNTPALLGTLEHVAEDGTRTASAVLQSFVLNQGDAWTVMLEGLRRDFETVVQRSLWGLTWGLAFGFEDQVRLLVQVEGVQS